MLQLIQDTFLNETFIFFILFVAFAIFSAYVIWGLSEIAGYGLGWLLALFFMIIYASLASGNETSPQIIGNGEIRLSLWQVLFSSFVGILMGTVTLYVLRQHHISRPQRIVKIAFITALGLLVIFFMFVASPVERRMIGIFVIAFSIGALFTAVLYQPVLKVASPTIAQIKVAQSSSRLDQIREQMRRDR